MSREWLSFLAVARPTLDRAAVGSVLCLDPGETTGFARFEDGQLVEAGEWATPDPSSLADAIHALAAVHYLDLLLYEEYRVRGNKFKEHVGSEVVTIQHIGAIKVVAAELAVRLAKQSAGMAKGFATDAKLRRWGLYQRGSRHANDAVRHGIYWILFTAGRKEPR